MKVLIVGGGIVGLSTACSLAEAGHAVQVVERERTGSRASWVAAGLLTPSSPWRYPPALIDLCHRSEAMYPGFVESLHRHTGFDPQLETAGMLYPVGVGFGAAAIEESRARRVALGFDVASLDREELDALQPGLGEVVTGAAWQPVSSRVRPPRLLAALRARALQLDVSLVEHCAVSSIQRSGGAVTGVRTEGGQELGADVTVLAAGAWSGLLAATAELDLALRPVRGQILLLKGPPGLLEPVINNGDCYLVPRRDGRILVGSTMEDAGFDAVTTPAALTRLRELASTLLPATAALPVETDWAGLRPGTLDRMPYLGAVPDLPGLVLATGHFRNGILLAPITAALVADVIEGREPAVELGPFACREVDPSATIVPAASS